VLSANLDSRLIPPAVAVAPLNHTPSASRTTSHRYTSTSACLVRDTGDRAGDERCGLHQVTSAQRAGQAFKLPPPLRTLGRSTKPQEAPDASCRPGVAAHTRFLPHRPPPTRLTKQRSPPPPHTHITPALKSRRQSSQKARARPPCLKPWARCAARRPMAGRCERAGIVSFPLNRIRSSHTSRVSTRV